MPELNRKMSDIQVAAIPTVDVPKLLVPQGAPRVPAGNRLSDVPAPPSVAQQVHMDTLPNLIAVALLADRLRTALRGRFQRLGAAATLGVLGVVALVGAAGSDLFSVNPLFCLVPAGLAARRLTANPATGRRRSAR